MASGGRSWARSETEFIQRTTSDPHFVARFVRSEFARIPYCAVTPVMETREVTARYTTEMALPGVSDLRAAFFAAMRAKAYPRYLCVAVSHDRPGQWARPHAMFLLCDLQAGLAIGYDPWGGQAVASPLGELARRMCTVVGALRYLGSASICPYYGPQTTLQLAAPPYGTDVCVLLNVLVCKAFLQRLHGVFRDATPSPAQFLAAFRAAQLDVGASDSPLNIRSVGKVQAAIARLAHRYVADNRPDLGRRRGGLNLSIAAS